MRNTLLLAFLGGGCGIWWVWYLPFFLTLGTSSNYHNFSNMIEYGLAMTPASSLLALGSMPSHPKDSHMSPCLRWSIRLHRLWLNLPSPLAIFVSFKPCHKAHSSVRLKADFDTEDWGKEKNKIFSLFHMPHYQVSCPIRDCSELEILSPGEVWVSKFCRFLLLKIWTVSVIVFVKKFCERKENRRLWMWMFAEKENYRHKQTVFC